MADRVQFQKKLGELLAVAASQNNKMTSQEVQAFFQDDNLTDEQMNLVHEFLMSQKVEVIGYTGTIENTEKTEQEEKDTLSQQEKDYVADGGRGNTCILSSQSCGRSSKAAYAGNLHR